MHTRSRTRPSSPQDSEGASEDEILFVFRRIAEREEAAAEEEEEEEDEVRAPYRVEVLGAVSSWVCMRAHVSVSARVHALACCSATPAVLVFLRA